MRSLEQQYLKALNILYNEKDIVIRNKKCRECLLYTFIINPDDNVITIPGFETNIKYAINEYYWYLSKSNKINYSSIIEKTWKKFSDDGITVNSAYGHRIFGEHKDFINQWEWVKNKIKQDKHTRQAIININYPGDKLKETKDFVCTIYIQIFIRNNKLIWITNMRSQDIYYGTRNDIYCFTEMQKLMARQLKIKPGEYIHICNSLHIYEEQYQKMNNVITKK